MSSEKFENLEDDLSSAIDKLRPLVESISRFTGGKIFPVYFYSFSNVTVTITELLN